MMRTFRETRRAGAAVFLAAGLACATATGASAAVTGDHHGPAVDAGATLDTEVEADVDADATLDADAEVNDGVAADVDADADVDVDVDVDAEADAWADVAV